MKQVIVIVSVFVITAWLSGGAIGQNYQELRATVNGPWHHVPNPTSDLAFNREIAKCRVIAEQTPVDSTTPAVIEIVKMRVTINCLKAAGYEPRNSDTRTLGAPSAPIKMAGFGPGISLCAQFNGARGKREEMEFYSWGQGFLTGYNLSDPNNMVELATWPVPEQLRFLRSYCDKYGDKKFLDATIALIQALRNAK